MDTKRFLELGGVMAFGLFVAASVVALQSTTPGATGRPSMQPAGGPDYIVVPADIDESGLEAVAVLAPKQAESTCPAGVTRIVNAESWEGSAATFPNTRSPNWRTFDALASAPGRNDEIMWGQADCEASVGSASAWVVGGGTSGKRLSCEQRQYPPDLGTNCRTLGQCRINTSLQFISFDTTVSNRITGMRLTLDYLADIPVNDGARFFVGIGDFSREARATDGSITIHELYEAGVHFPADTGGTWRRGQEISFERITKVSGEGYKELMLTFAYRHDPATSSDGFGVMMDNLHIDFLFDGTTLPCPSPPTPFPTIPTETPTRPVFTVAPTTTATPTPGPTRIRQKFVPMALRNGASEDIPTPPTAPTPTITPTPVPSNTPTSPPTDTPRPSDTPLPTITPTFTPEPRPDVMISDVGYRPRSNVQSITIVNRGTGGQDMTGWAVFPQVKVPVQICRFSADYVLEPGGEFNFFAGRGAADAIAEDPLNSKLCGNGREYIFDQQQDSARLLDNFQNVRSRFCWDGNGPYFCAP